MPVAVRLILRHRVAMNIGDTSLSGLPLHRKLIGHSMSTVPSPKVPGGAKYFALQIRNEIEGTGNSPARTRSLEIGFAHSQIGRRLFT